jgi:hypothetical protein
MRVTLRHHVNITSVNIGSWEGILDLHSSMNKGYIYSLCWDLKAKG